MRADSKNVRGETMLYSLIAFCAGFAMDLLFGDPLGNFHFVVWIGKGIALLGKAFRRIFPRHKRGEICGGALLVVCVCAVAFTLSAAALFLFYRVHIAAGLVLESFLCWQCFAMRSLKDESMRVYESRGDMARMRAAVGRIVGRDTDALDGSGVFRACVETIAENASDGEIAPMLYIALGGAPLGVLYKAINTMDSMLGYKNERYLYFGKAAARLDDGANFLPSRITALLMSAFAGLVGLDGKNAFRIFKRDRYRHASPNSAQPEAACAGALHVRLGGPASYFGKPVENPTIGDDDRPIEAEDIVRANRLLYAAGISFFVLCVIVRGTVMILC